jgi:hypothetical protein
MIIIDPSMDEDTSSIIGYSARICENLFKLTEVEVLITFNEKASEGYEAVTIPGKDKFLVALNPNIAWDEDELVKTIGHELTHVKQFTYDGLKFEFEDVVVFKDNEYRFENSMEYWLSPWEIEARGYEAAILVLYLGENNEKGLTSSSSAFSSSHLC